VKRTLAKSRPQHAPATGTCQDCWPKARPCSESLSQHGACEKIDRQTRPCALGYNQAGYKQVECARRSTAHTKCLHITKAWGGASGAPQSRPALNSLTTATSPTALVTHQRDVAFWAALQLPCCGRHQARLEQHLVHLVVVILGHLRNDQMTKSRSNDDMASTTVILETDHMIDARA
jgi:hypothetical protein